MDEKSQQIQKTDLSRGVLFTAFINSSFTQANVHR